MNTNNKNFNENQFYCDNYNYESYDTSSTGNIPKTQPKYYRSINEFEYKRKLIPRVTYPFFYLNCLTGGAEEGTVNIICSHSDNGKSTFVMNLIDTFIRDGEKIGVFLGEHTFEKAQSIFYKQITTFNKDTWQYVNYEKNGKPVKGVGDFFIGVDDEKKAREFFDEKLFLFDYEKYEPTMKNLLNFFEQIRVEKKTRVFVIDNMMQISYEKVNQELQEQRDNAELLRQWAMRTKSIVFFVMHLKKFADRNTIKISIDDIFGSSNVSNKANTIMALYRTDKLDKTSSEYKRFAKFVDSNNFDIEKCDSIVDVLKVKSNSSTARLGVSGLQFFSSTQSYKEIDPILPYTEWKEKTKKNVNYSGNSSNVNNNTDFSNMDIEEDDDGLPF